MQTLNAVDPHADEPTAGDFEDGGAKRAARAAHDVFTRQLDGQPHLVFIANAAVALVEERCRPIGERDGDSLFHPSTFVADHVQ
jgi:hypothetical protein